MSTRGIGYLAAAITVLISTSWVWAAGPAAVSPGSSKLKGSSASTAPRTASATVTPLAGCSPGPFGDDYNTTVGCYTPTVWVENIYNPPGNTNPTAGVYNTFLGAYSGFSTNAGIANTFVGYQAGYVNSTGGYNTYIGHGTGNKGNGGDNTFIGYAAGNMNTAAENTFVGSSAGDSNTTGDMNSFFGRSAGRLNKTGVGNTFVGYGAGDNNGAGSYNTFIGYYSGTGIFSPNGSGNVFIGAYTGVEESGSNLLYIDNCYFGLPLCNKPFIKGDFAARTLKIDGTLTMVTVATPSDERYKKEVRPLDSSLEKVMQLKGVSYSWNKDTVMGAGFKDGRQIGLIAQEVEKVLPELVQTDEKGYKTLSYDKVVPVLIEAVKEQQATIAGQQKTITVLSQNAAAKDAEIDSLKKSMMEITSRLAAIESSGRTVASK